MPDHITPKGTTPVPYRRDAPPPRPSRRELLKVVEALLMHGSLDRRALLEATGLDRDSLRKACTYLQHVREVRLVDDHFELTAERPTVDTPPKRATASIDLRTPPAPITTLVQPAPQRPVTRHPDVSATGQRLIDAMREAYPEEETRTCPPSPIPTVPPPPPVEPVPAPEPKQRAPSRPKRRPPPPVPPKPKPTGPNRRPKRRPPYMDPPPPIPDSVRVEMRRAVQFVYDHPGVDAYQIAKALDLESPQSAGAFMRWAIHRKLVQRTADKPARYFPPRRRRA